MKWIIENADWVFSGIGIAILTVLGGLFRKKKLDNKNSQTINSGNNSNNIQGGGNINVNIGGENDA